MHASAVLPNPTEAIPTQPITATDLLRTIYRHPGPYTTVYLATVATPGDGRNLRARWHDLRSDLEAQSAPYVALEAIEARTALLRPDDTGAMMIIAAGNGTTVVEHGMEPPLHDYGVVDTLPHVAPLLEWHQRRLPHLIVVIDQDGADIASFGHQHRTKLETVKSGRHTGGNPSLADRIAQQADTIQAELVIMAGEPDLVGPLADRLEGRLAPNCRVMTEPTPGDAEELTDRAVRHLSDAAARTTVGYLRQRRYLQAHDAAVDGAADTVKALAEGAAEVLLIHDDPLDQRRCWVGSEPQEISLQPSSRLDVHARLVDAAIRSAVLQGTTVHVIPSSGPGGPDQDTAAITGDPGGRPGGEPTLEW